MQFSSQDKILQSTGRGRSVTVTNDGATILKSLHIDNPAAKVLVGILYYFCFGLSGLFFCLVEILLCLCIQDINNKVIILSNS